jgi:hypothetical protein
MLVFLDESWQATKDHKFKVGVLAAVAIKSLDFNKCSARIRELKIKHLGFQAGSVEIKGHHIFREYLFKLEKDKGIISRELSLARDILSYLTEIGGQIFASVVFAEKDIDLACADSKQLERPFFFLFERIDLFMKENHPGIMANLIFDDRHVRFNENLSESMSNFFHKCSVGKSFDNVIKVPFFAISNDNVGIQIADMVAYLVGSSYLGDSIRREFSNMIKGLRFTSRTKVGKEGESKYTLFGIKVIKEKEAGDLFDPGRAK